MVTRMLEGKITLVTGAGSGIGRSSALVFARHGAKLVIADIDARAGQETADMVREAAGEAFFVRADVSKSADVEALVGAIVAEHGRLDCAFNNAGVDGASGLLADMAEDNWDHVVGVNLKGVWLCMKHEIRQMLLQGGGAIVNNASVLGLVGYPRRAAYVASKHGVVGLTRAAALEHAKQNIRVNAVCPAVIRTPLVDAFIRAGSRTEEQLAAFQPIGRLGTADEVGEAAAWLCSERASFVLGHALPVDGGWVAP